MIEDDLCLSIILGRSMRLFLGAGVIVERLFSSDSDPDAEDNALDSVGESCTLCCCGALEV